MVGSTTCRSSPSEFKYQIPDILDKHWAKAQLTNVIRTDGMLSCFECYTINSLYLFLAGCYPPIDGGQTPSAFSGSLNITGVGNETRLTTNRFYVS